jgi:hypothetical protein
MTTDSVVNDLVILCADKNMEATLGAILPRAQPLGIKNITYKIYVHAHHDAGCLNSSDQFLRNFINQYKYALVVFDLEGCGEELNRVHLEEKVENKLARVGWKDRSAVIVLDPELEIWVWTRSPHVDDVLGWGQRVPTVRDWLIQRNHIRSGNHKPERPKEALEAALREVRTPRSSALYAQLASRVSLHGHNEPAFIKLRTILAKWFSE